MKCLGFFRDKYSGPRTLGAGKQTWRTTYLIEKGASCSLVHPFPELASFLLLGHRLSNLTVKKTKTITSNIILIKFIIKCILI